MTLPAHPWDDQVHRAAIHEAFNHWFQAYDQGCLTQAHRLHVQLGHLIDDAEGRRLCALLGEPIACGSSSGHEWTTAFGSPFCLQCGSREGDQA